MSEWSEGDLDALNTAYWADAVPPCPQCGKRVRMTVSPEITDQPPDMFAECMGCGREAQFQAAKERGRDFTEAELEGLIDKFELGEKPRCPHDGTRLEHEELTGIGAKSGYWMRCPRCGASGELEPVAREE